MKINCAKCGRHIANVEKPSTLAKGATLYGVCYECKTESLHNGATGDFGKRFLRFLQEFKR